MVGRIATRKRPSPRYISSTAQIIWTWWTVKQSLCWSRFHNLIQRCFKGAPKMYDKLVVILHRLSFLIMSACHIHSRLVRTLFLRSEKKPMLHTTPITLWSTGNFLSLGLLCNQLTLVVIKYPEVLLLLFESTLIQISQFFDWHVIISIIGKDNFFHDMQKSTPLTFRQGYIYHIGVFFLWKTKILKTLKTVGLHPPSIKIGWDKWQERHFWMCVHCLWLFSDALASLALMIRHDICQNIYTSRLWTNHILPVKV